MVWHHKRRMPGGYATKRTTFELLRGSEGVSGVDQLPAPLVIPGNGNSVTPTFRYKLGDADATDVAPWGYGETLAAQGSGGVFNDGSPFVGASDDSFNPNGTRYLRASGSTLANVTTEDMVVELVVKGGATGRAIMSKFSAGNAGWLCYINSGSTYRAFITDGANTAESASVGFMLPGQWYHFLSFCDRSGSGVTYQNGLVGTPASMTAVGSLTNSLSTTLGAYDNGTVISTGNIAYAAVWLGDGLLDSHLQPDLAQERFQRLCGLWPKRARGTKAWTVFTRATSAVTDKVEYGAELLPSTDPTVGWLETRATVALDTSVSHPEGAAVYALSEDDTDANNHQLFEQTATLTAATEVEYSVDVRAAGRDWVAVRSNDNVSDPAWASERWVYFDVSNGAVGTETGDVVASSIELLGGGWYRCRARTLVDATDTGLVHIYTAEGDADINCTTALDAVGLYIANLTLRTWESKLYTVGAGMPRMVHRQKKTSGAEFKGYLPETEDENELTYSEDLSNAAWAKTRSTINSDGMAAPDGTTTMDGIIGSAVANTHYVGQSVASISGQHLFSFYAKAGAQDWAYCNIPSVANANAYFDLSTGEVGTVGAGADATHVEPVGNGVFRCSLEYTGGVPSHAHDVYAAEADNDNSFTGDGSTTDIWAWGMSHSDDVTDYPTSYIRTEATAVTRNADVLYLKGDDGNVANNQRGTMEVEILVPDADMASYNTYLSLNDGGSIDNRVIAYRTGGNDAARFFGSESGNAQWLVTGATDTSDGDAHTVRGTWQADDAKLYIDGSSEGTPDTSATPPDDLDRISIGTAAAPGAFQANAPIRNVRIWPKPTTKE